MVEGRFLRLVEGAEAGTATAAAPQDVDRLCRRHSVYILLDIVTGSD